MKTAMVSVLSLGGAKSSTMNSSPAVLSAVDAYATRVLQTMSPPEAYIDTSLGPYVTNLLRATEIQDKEQVTKIAEFDSLLELLEDQCSMEQETATNALKEIANAVCTGTVPNEGGHESSSVSLFPVGALDSYHARTPGRYQGQYGRNEHMSIDPYTPNSAGGPSPLKPDNLIPVDLLGALDDPSPQMSRYQTQQRFTVQEQKDELPKNEDSFPPLGASTTAPPKKGGRGKKGSKTQHHDKDLAASLFRPARPRQNSIETEEAALAKAPAPAVSRIPSANTNNRYFQQQWDSSVEILLSMNPELSEEAAAEASLMANTDFNLAQYIIDAAMSAPPVCRHMLHDGCYRSDCQFSHDVDGHTCLFWLRGRCGKGKSCKFLHGFNDKILAGIQLDSSPSPVGISAPVPITDSSHTNTGGNQYSSFQASSAPTSDGFLVFPGPSTGFDTQGYDDGRLGSSWQSPSLLQSSMSRSYSSSDSRSGVASSFANIASRGMDKAQFPSPSETIGSSSVTAIPTVRIPQDLWNPHENRDSSVFHIPDPLERYYQASVSVTRRDVIDLHFQSVKTFPVVLSAILPGKLADMEEVWIVTGTGHHVGSKTHQKAGGALERATITWLTEEGYNFAKGRDRNGLGGALLVKR